MQKMSILKKTLGVQLLQVQSLSKQVHKLQVTSPQLSSYYNFLLKLPGQSLVAYLHL